MLVNYFVVLILLLLVSGLAIDAGMLQFWQVRVQNAADAAAQQAMYQFGRNDSAFVTEGRAQASANGFTNGSNGASVSITQPPTSGVWINDAWSVQATVSQTYPNSFMTLIGAPKSTVSATATARVLPTCVWILNPTNTTTSPSFWLASATLAGPCGLYVATTSGPSIDVDASSTLLNLRSRLVGTSAENSSTGSINPVPKYSSAKKNDPLAYVTSPSFSSCSTSGIVLNNLTLTMNPGTYCNGLTITNSTIGMNAGLYIITGSLNISGSTISGLTGVTIFLTSGGGGGYGNVTISNSSIKLKAATSTSGGTVPGIVVFGDRNWISHGNKGVTITNTPIQFDGIWYLPNVGVSFSTSPLSFYSYSGLVVDNLYMQGAISTMSVDYAPLGSFITGTPYHYEDGALVQ